MLSEIDMAWTLDYVRGTFGSRVLSPKRRRRFAEESRGFIVIEFGFVNSHALGRR
jgi:hypothetical protein